MEILFISEYYPPWVMGGGEINLALIAKALVKGGISVTVLTSRQEGLKSSELIDGVTVYRRLVTGKNPQSLFQNVKRRFHFSRSIVKEASKLCSHKEMDLIHFIGASVIAAPRLKYLNLPLVATVESYPALCPKGDRIYHGKEECTIVCSLTQFIGCQRNSLEIGKMRNNLYLKYNPVILAAIYRYYQELTLGLRHCKLIAISEYVKKLLHLHGLESVVVPNLLDAETFNKINKKITSAFNKFNKKSEDKPKILFIGSLATFKGPQVLLKALRNSSYRGDFYGSGYLQMELKNYISKNKLDVEVHPPVSYEKIPKIYSQADVVVFPSLWPEPFGRIALEAMASGVPIVASRIGAIPEILNWKEEALFDPGNYLQLRNKIDRILSDKKLWNELSSFGKKLVKQNYSQEITIKKLTTYYNEAVS